MIAFPAAKREHERKHVAVPGFWEIVQSIGSHRVRSIMIESEQDNKMMPSVISSAAAARVAPNGSFMIKDAYQYSEECTAFANGRDRANREMLCGDQKRQIPHDGQQACPYSHWPNCDQRRCK